MKKSQDVRVGDRVMIDGGAGNYKVTGRTRGYVEIVTDCGTHRSAHNISNVTVISRAHTPSEESSMKLSALKSEEERLQKELLETQAKITYLEDTKQETASDYEYRVYKALSAINSGASIAEQAKAIAPLLDEVARR